MREVVDHSTELLSALQVLSLVIENDMRLLVRWESDKAEVHLQDPQISGPNMMLYLESPPKDSWSVSEGSSLM